MRKPLVVANWKMNKTREDAAHFAETLGRKLPHASTGRVDIVICPTFIHLEMMAGLNVLPVGVAIGAQDCHWEDSGAFTGCVSSMMLKDMKVKYAIVGHSERRRYFYENNAMLAAKLRSALAAGLAPIFCVGETLQDRQKGETKAVLSEQMKAFAQVAHICAKVSVDFVLAYEPVWAIGTGQTATSAQAQEAHSYLRAELAQSLGSERAAITRILYGGSITPENFKSLLEGEDVDGGLVGGASLKPESFLKLIELASN